MASDPRLPSISEKRIKTFAMLGVLLGALLINFRILSFDWVFFDDDINILFNPHLNGWTSSSLHWAWTDIAYSGRYLPLGWMLYDGVFAFSGLDPFGYHFVGWLLSGLNAVLLFNLIIVWLRDLEVEKPTPNSGYHRTILAAVAGTLFWTLHPLRAETVAWNASLIYQLSTSFALLAAWIFLSAAWDIFARVRRWRLVGAFLAYAASLMVYPIFLGLPLALALAMWSRRAVQSARALWSWLAVWLGLAVAWGSLNLVTTVITSGPSVIPDTTPLWEKITLMGRMQATLWVHHIWPAQPSPIYGANSTFFTTVSEWMILAIVVGLVAAFARNKFQRWKICIAWGAAAFVLFAPFVVKYHIVVHPSDRYAIGSLIVFAFGFASLTRWSSDRWRWTLPSALAVLAIILVTYQSALSTWKNADTLATRIDETARGLDVELAYGASAQKLWFIGFRESANRRLAEGERLSPNNPQLAAIRKDIANQEQIALDNPSYHSVLSPLAIRHCEWGRYALNQKDYRRAAAHFKEALRQWPEFPLAAAGLLRAQDAQ